MLSNSNISFYKVDLVCNVVSSIGCGSRSKPILLELEKESRIDQVKLNRKGNTLAIRWINNNITSRAVIIASVFSKYSIVVKEINGKDNHEQSNSFLKDSSNWLDANHIDELSWEEAGVVAKQLIAIFEAQAILTSNQKTRLKKDTVAIFYNFFLNFESMQQLSDTHFYRKLVIRVIETSKDYIHFNETPKIEILLEAIEGHHENKDQTKCCN